MVVSFVYEGNGITGEKNFKCKKGIHIYIHTCSGNLENTQFPLSDLFVLKITGTNTYNIANYLCFVLSVYRDRYCVDLYTEPHFTPLA